MSKNKDTSQQKDNNFNNNKNNSGFISSKELMITSINDQKDLDQFIINKKNNNQGLVTDFQQSQQINYNNTSTYSIDFYPQNKSKIKQKLDAAQKKYINHQKKCQNNQQQLNKKEEIERKNTQQIINKEKYKEQDNQILDKIKKAKQSFQKQFKEQKSGWIPQKMYIVDYQLAKSQKQIILKEKYKVYFPYQPYQIQLEYMNKVISTLQKSANAILQSPTGTGKTLCLLASVLSFAEEQYKKNLNKTKIIFMSRTHSQLSQIQKQLSKTCYRPNMSVFASREQLCIKEQLKFLKGNQKIEACGKGVKMAIKYRRKLQKVQPKLQEIYCKYYNQKQQTLAIQNKQLAHKLLNVKMMRQKGQQLQFCPYFYPFDVKHLSTLLLMPYNYILDSFLMANYTQIIKDSILIFDEAHNVPQTSCQGKSVSMQSNHLQMGILQLNKILSNNISPQLYEVKSKYQKQIKYMLKILQQFKQTFRQFVKQNLLNDKSSNRQSFQQDIQIKMINKHQTDFKIYELFYGPVPDQRRQQFSQRSQYYQKMMQIHILSPLQQFSQYGSQIIEQLKQTPDGKAVNFQKVLILCKVVQDLMKPFVKNVFNDKNQIDHYRLKIQKKKSPLNNTINYKIQLTCLMPFLIFQDLKKHKPKSIVLTSGTLKPLQIWSKQLEIPFQQKLINKHVIKKDQLIAKIIKKGFSDSLMNFSYDSLNRNKEKIYKDLILLIINIAKTVPNGILMIFPSFKIQNDFKYYLSSSSQKQELQFYKDIMYQQKNAQFDIKKFKNKCQSSKGVILMIVCRGKMSQGMDFPDDMCRAVVMVGVPWPNIRDPYIVQKKNHLQSLVSKAVNKSEALRGNQWYTVGTFRAINQGLGRVIRHVKDYGSIFLVDSRYQQKQNQKQLPNWVLQSLQIVQKVNQDLFDQIKSFFQTMKIKYKIKQKRQWFQQDEQKQKQKPKNAFETLMARQNDKKISMIKQKKVIPNKWKKPQQTYDF